MKRGLLNMVQKLFTLTLIAGIGVFFTACSDDETPGPGPVTITGIPEAAQVAIGDDLVVQGVTLTADRGIATFGYTVDGGSNNDLTGLVTVGATTATVDITIATTGLTAGDKTVVFTLTDSNGQSTTVTHTLTLSTFGIVIVESNITENTTWNSNNVYILATRVTVADGVTLTIEAGTIVKGEAGTGPNATSLLIARGAILNAGGTAAEPIIFTAADDDIEPGQIASPNVDPSLPGLWGGLIILGKAPISADAEAVQIEGIPPEDQNGLYGGTDPADNSGTIRYISIRHGGANIGEGNEINGLTLGGVGSGTTIEYVEIVANQDDGIEWFGGTVDVSNVLVWNTGDDAIDTDQAWTGTLDNFIIVNPGDECFELDGPEGSGTGGHTITNGTVSAGDASGLIDFDDNSDVAMSNVYFTDLTAGQDIEQFDLCASCTIQSFEATIPGGSTLTDFFTAGSDTNVSAVNDGTNTIGATVSAFAFTWASVSGALDDF